MRNCYKDSCRNPSQSPTGILHSILQESFTGSYRDPTGILHKILQESFTGSYRNPSPDPTGILYRILQESFTGSYRNPLHDPTGILHRILQESFTGSYRNPSQDPTGILHRILQESFTGSYRNPTRNPAGIQHIPHESYTGYCRTRNPSVILQWLFIHLYNIYPFTDSYSNPRMVPSRSLRCIRRKSQRVYFTVMYNIDRIQLSTVHRYCHRSVKMY